MYEVCWSVPAAIAFHAEHAWGGVQTRCHQLLAHLIKQWQDANQMTPAYATTGMFRQMAIMEVPFVDDLAAFQVNFLHEHGVEVPLTQHLTNTFVRVSVQAYNDEADSVKLLAAFQEIFF